MDSITLAYIRRPPIGVVEVFCQSLSVWLLSKGEGGLGELEQKGAGCGHFHCQMLKFDNETGKRTGSRPLSLSGAKV